MNSEHELSNTDMFPGVAREMQLQTLLTDERSRGEQHKKNYQRLKADHNRLEEDHVRLRNELQQINEDLQKTQTSSTASLDLAQKALHDKQQELDVLRVQLSRPTTDLRTPSRDPSNLSRKLSVLQNDYEALHQEFNRQRYQNSMEQTQAQADLMRARREAQKLQTRHAIELQALQEVMEALTSSPASPDAFRNVHQALERENHLLRSRMEALLEEVASLRSEAQTQSAGAEDEVRSHLRAMAMQVTKLREVESEKQNLQLLTEALRSELHSSRESHSLLLGKQRTLKRELSDLGTLLSRTEDAHRAQIVHLEEELATMQRLAEMAKDAAEAQGQGLELELKLSRETEANLVAQMAEREAKWELKSTAEKDDICHRLKQAEKQRQSLERQLMEMEADARRREAVNKDQVQLLENRLRAQSSAQEKEQLEIRNLQNEISELQGALERSNQLGRESEREKEEALRKVLEMQRRVKGQTEKFRKQAQQTQEKLQSLQSGEMQEIKTLNKLLQEQEEKHNENKDRLNKKIEELKFQLQNLNLINSKDSAERSKKMKRLIKYNTKYRLELSELKSKKDKIKPDRVSADEHKCVLQLLHDLQHRLQLFGGFLNSSSPVVPLPQHRVLAPGSQITNGDTEKTKRKPNMFKKKTVSELSLEASSQK